MKKFTKIFSPFRKISKRWLLVIYILLLIASFFVRRNQPNHRELFSDEKTVEVQTVKNNALLEEKTRIAYRDFKPFNYDENTTTILLLHGSPGSGRDMLQLAADLAKNNRVIVPDNPGFGGSSIKIPDYSVRAHALYMLQFLNQLEVQNTHIVAFSMGGGVALNLADQAPNRVKSLSLISAIGVQEMELLGDYHLNHGLHGLQLAAFWLLREATPHFGWLDNSILGVSYARNFYDTDQRPLREMLTRLKMPVQIIHGEHDSLVPYAAALEHERLVPQSKLITYDASHFMVFGQTEKLAADILPFIDKVENKTAKNYFTASAERIEKAQLPFDPKTMPKIKGITLGILFFVIIFATFVSEDLTCIITGLLVARGAITFQEGTLACFLGIFIGDLLLYFAGKYLGGPILRNPPFSWMISPTKVKQARQWFAHRGAIVILLGRFVPGMRLPTYFAAGMLRTPFSMAAFHFAIAVALWAPLLVGASAFLGNQVQVYFELYQSYALWVFLAVCLFFLIVMKLLIPLFTFRGRRLLLARWRRLTHFEFWHDWVFHIPIVFYIFWLGIKYRGFTLFTSANPCMPASGFINESKSEIMQGLNHSPLYLAGTMMLSKKHSVEEQQDLITGFMDIYNLEYPIVLKPDSGQRGFAVKVAHSDQDVENYLKNTRVDIIVQEHCRGREFGVFYYRYPMEEEGTIFSITEKVFPEVIGDGKSTIEKLILLNDRTVCIAPTYFNENSTRLYDVPAWGEKIKLVEIGSHARGSLFLDGREIYTEKLRQTFDKISRNYEGFYFGRFDIRTPDIAAFKNGKNFKIMELNGATSIATNIYDPKYDVKYAWSTMFRQWHILFEIGRQNRNRGHRQTSLRKLIKLYFQFQKNHTENIS